MVSALPSFSFDIQVTPKSGKQDKMEIHLPWGNLVGSQRDIDDVRQALGSPSAAERRRFSLSTLEDRGWIFNRPEQTATTRKKLTIRKRACKLSNGDILEIPLFGGNLSFSNYYRGNPNRETSSRLRLKIRLNPTRFARSQRPRFGLDGNTMIEPQQLLFRQRDLPAGFRGEFALDEADNWIPNSYRYSHFCNSSVWPTLVRNYISGTLRCITEEMERACSSQGVDWAVEQNQLFSLHYVETYWEFSAPDPLKVVALCEVLLRRYTENLTRKRFFKTLVEGEIIHNSRSISVMVRTGVQLVIYSKTNLRVRIEVRHHLRDCSDVIGGSVYVRSMGGLCKKIQAVRNDAANVVNDAFKFMQSRSTFPKYSATVGQFLFDMVQAVGHWSSAGTLLSMLLENGKIVIDSTIKPHVHALRKAEIIQPQNRNRKRLYIITDRYARALEELSLSNKPLLQPRQRKRKLGSNNASDTR